MLRSVPLTKREPVLPVLAATAGPSTTTPHNTSASSSSHSIFPKHLHRTSHQQHQYKHLTLAQQSLVAGLDRRFSLLLLVSSTIGIIYALMAASVEKESFPFAMSLIVMTTVVLNTIFKRGLYAFYFRMLLMGALAVAMPAFYMGVGPIVEHHQRRLFDSLFLYLDQFLLGGLFPMGQLALSVEKSTFLGPNTFLGRVIVEVLQLSYVSYYFWGYTIISLLAIEYFFLVLRRRKLNAIIANHAKGLVEEGNNNMISDDSSSAVGLDSLEEDHEAATRPFCWRRPHVLVMQLLPVFEHYMTRGRLIAEGKQPKKLYWPSLVSSHSRSLRCDNILREGKRKLPSDSDSSSDDDETNTTLPAIEICLESDPESDDGGSNSGSNSDADRALSQSPPVSIESSPASMSTPARKSLSTSTSSTAAILPLAPSCSSACSASPTSSYSAAIAALEELQREEAMCWLRMKMFMLGWLGTYIVNFLLNLMLPAVSPRVYLADQYSVPLEGFGLTALLRKAVDSEAEGTYGTFPSGHVAISWMVGFFAQKFYPEILGSVVLSAAALISLATVYLRYHYFTDVLGAIPLIMFGLYISGLYPDLLQAISSPSKSSTSSSSSLAPEATSLPSAPSNLSALSQLHPTSVVYDHWSSSPSPSSPPFESAQNSLTGDPLLTNKRANKLLIV